jgi:hypothetical protein
MVTVDKTSAMSKVPKKIKGPINPLTNGMNLCACRVSVQVCYLER